MQTGDVIAYDWGDGIAVNHLSIVTSATADATEVSADTTLERDAPWDLGQSGAPEVRMYPIHIYSPCIQ